MERSNHLHNFSYPTWGTHKLSSCNNDYNPLIPLVNFHKSSDTQEQQQQHYIKEEILATREKLLREKILKTKVFDDVIQPFNVPCTNEVVNESRSEKKSTRPRRNLFKKDERPKFSISLSLGEIEEDLLAITGKRPSRKPKKRPRSLQTKLNALYPGSLLSEVHPDRYKVN